MGKRIEFNLTNFRGGIHSEPSMAETPEVFLKELNNLIPNSDGQLVPREGHTIEYTNGEGKKLQGAAYVVNTDGVGYVFVLADTDLLLFPVIDGEELGGEAPKLLVTDPAFSGQLSATSVHTDVIALTSAGADAGYWIQLGTAAGGAQDAADLAVAYPLGIPRPDTTYTRIEGAATTEPGYRIDIALNSLRGADFPEHGSDDAYFASGTAQAGSGAGQITDASKDWRTLDIRPGDVVTKTVGVRPYPSLIVGPHPRTRTVEDGVDFDSVLSGGASFGDGDGYTISQFNQLGHGTIGKAHEYTENEVTVEKAEWITSRPGGGTSLHGLEVQVRYLMVTVLIEAGAAVEVVGDVGTPGSSEPTSIDGVYIEAEDTTVVNAYDDAADALKERKEIRDRKDKEAKLTLGLGYIPDDPQIVARRTGPGKGESGYDSTPLGSFSASPSPPPPPDDDSPPGGPPNTTVVPTHPFPQQVTRKISSWAYIGDIVVFTFSGEAAELVQEMDVGTPWDDMGKTGIEEVGERNGPPKQINNRFFKVIANNDKTITKVGDVGHSNFIPPPKTYWRTTIVKGEKHLQQGKSTVDAIIRDQVQEFCIGWVNGIPVNAELWDVGGTPYLAGTATGDAATNESRLIDDELEDLNGKSINWNDPDLDIQPGDVVSNTAKNESLIIGPNFRVRTLGHGPLELEMDFDADLSGDAVFGLGDTYTISKNVWNTDMKCVAEKQRMNFGGIHGASSGTGRLVKGLQGQNATTTQISLNRPHPFLEGDTLAFKRQNGINDFMRGVDWQHTGLTFTASNPVNDDPEDYAEQEPGYYYYTFSYQRKALAVQDDLAITWERADAAYEVRASKYRLFAAMGGAEGQASALIKDFRDNTGGKSTISGPPGSTVEATGANFVCTWRSDKVDIDKYPSIWTPGTVDNATPSATTMKSYNTALNEIWKSATIGQVLRNITDRSEGIITSVDSYFKTTREITCRDGLYGGIDNTFTLGDRWEIVPPYDELNLELIDEAPIIHYRPDVDNDGSVGVTGITSAAEGVVSTDAAHIFTTGEIVLFEGVDGMTEVNYIDVAESSPWWAEWIGSGETADQSLQRSPWHGGKTWRVEKIDDTSFYLLDNEGSNRINTANFETETAGVDGTVKRVGQSNDIHDNRSDWQKTSGAAESESDMGKSKIRVFGRATKEGDTDTLYDDNWPTPLSRLELAVGDKVKNVSNGAELTITTLTLHDDRSISFGAPLAGGTFAGEHPTFRGPVGSLAGDAYVITRKRSEKLLPIDNYLEKIQLVPYQSAASGGGTKDEMAFVFEDSGQHVESLDSAHPQYKTLVKSDDPDGKAVSMLELLARNNTVFRSQAVNIMHEHNAKYEAGLGLNWTVQKKFTRVPITSRDGPVPAMKHIGWYNDRLWISGYGGGVRFSDVVDGDPHYFDWPADNEIFSHRGPIEFTTTMGDNVMVLGGPSCIGRLTGTSPMTFDTDWVVSDNGPVSNSAWALTGGQLFYVSPTGLHAFDGASVQNVTGSLLERFRDSAMDPASAAIGVVPGGELVVCWAEDSQAAETYVLDIRRGTWRQASAVAFDFMSLENAGEHRLYYLVRDDDPSIGAKSVNLGRWRHGFEGRAGEIAVGLDSITGPSLEWEVETSELDWASQGLSSAVKRFDFLTVLLRESTDDVTAEVSVDGVSQPAIVGTVHRPPFTPFRIPIGRRGRKLTLKLSGEGDVQIESLGVTAWV